MTDRTVRSVLVACLLAASAGAQSARQASGPTLLREAAGGPKPRIIIEPPLAAPLSFGTAVVGYQTRGLQVAPVFGPAALAVSPRVGHVHVSVDDAPWVWANTSGQPVIVRGLLPGRHKVVMQLVNASHQPLDRGAVEFTVPERVKAPVEAATRAAPVDAARTQPAAKLFIDSPLPEPLSRGVVIIPYRTENVQLVPIFGAEALALSRASDTCASPSTTRRGNG